MLLEAKDIVKEYKSTNTKALDHVSIGIEKGEILGLLGPNGAGKSSLINIIAGLLTANSGDLFWEKKKIINHKLLSYKIGLVPQDIALYPKLSAYENLNFIATQYQIKRKERKLRINHLLQSLGLYKQRNKLISEFSGGMKRRINLIAGLIQQPELLIMDEPTVGIDIQSKQAIQHYLIELNKEGVSMLYTSHMLEEAQNICHRVAIMDQGRIIVTASPEELIKHNPEAINLEDVFIQLTGKELRD